MHEGSAEYVVVVVERSELGWLSLALDNWCPNSAMDRPEDEYGKIRKRWDNIYHAFHGTSSRHMPYGVLAMRKEFPQ